MTGKERIVSMVRGEAVDGLPLMPITMMFAGDLAGVRYRDYVTDYRVLADAQLRTAEQFGFDYVSTISDPTREAADCGAALEWFDNQPPAIDEEHALLVDPAALATLDMPDPLGGGRMHDRVSGIALLKERAAGKLVEGWVEGPCAEAADLRGINRLMMDFYERPGFVTELFEFALEMGLAFGKAQAGAGAELMGVGDAAASLVGPAVYTEYVWPYEKRLVDGLHDMGLMVRMHICGDTRPLLEALGRLGCEIVDLDYMVPVADARTAMGPGQVLLGNIDPVGVLRNGDPDTVTRAIAKCHADAGPRYIVGAGCEVVRDTPHANLEALRGYARNPMPLT